MSNFLNNWFHRNIRPISVGWFLATRQIRRSSKWTTGLIVFIMILTFLNLVVVSGLLVGLLTGSYGQFKESYSGDVFITPKPGRTYIEDSPQVIAFLANHPEVQAFSTRYSALATVLGTLDDNPLPKEKANQAGAIIMGIDPENEETVTGFSRFVIDGQPLKKGDDDGMLIGANLIKEYSSFADVDIPGLDLLKGVQVGSRVRVTLAASSVTPGRIRANLSSTTQDPVVKEFVVRGIVKSKVDQISTRMFVVDSTLRRLLSTNEWELEEIAVLTKSGKDTTVQADLKKYVDGRPIRVQTSQEAIPSFLRDIETTFNILGNALSSIALVVATITIFIVIFINAVTRRKFIGIMKGIGIEPRAIQAAYTIQAVFYGIIGSGIGLMLTFLVMRPYFAQNPIDFPFSDGILDVTWTGALLRVLILLVVTVVAGFVPAKLIVRKNTLDSILGR